MLLIFLGGGIATPQPVDYRGRAGGDTQALTLGGLADAYLTSGGASDEARATGGTGDE